MDDTGNERGVSEVLGVVLLVSITALLAATAASMSLGFQDELADQSPTMAVTCDFDIEDGSHVFRVGHAGGDTVPADAIRTVVNGADCGGPQRGTRFTSAGLGVSVSETGAGGGSNSRGTVCGSSDLDLSTARVAAVWLDPGGDSSRTRWQRRGPTA
jgi:FlaG/FlaF family flagellin (archaellin)